MNQDVRRLKFSDPERTLEGEVRAEAPFLHLRTLWFNTGSLCNISCGHCYMHSSPKNDSLLYLTFDEVRAFLDEGRSLGLEEVGFTGGEPFMNPEIIAMLGESLGRGHPVLVLTNAMKPLGCHHGDLTTLKNQFGEALTLRVSLDHYTAERHDAERGKGAWDAVMTNLAWLRDEGFSLALAGRTRWNEPPEAVRDGYAQLVRELNLSMDADDPTRLVLFPEMDGSCDTPEITTRCWDILGLRPDQMMCATSRMVVRRKGEATAKVAACTLLPQQEEFDLGPTLHGALRPVKLNHPHCSKFCVLGGCSCSVG